MFFGLVVVASMTGWFMQHVDFQRPASDSTSTSLIRRVRAFDDGAWNQLVHVYGPLVYSTCRRRGLSEHDAADVVQNVFAKVFSSIRRFRREKSEDTFRGWLRKITRDHVADHYRGQRDEVEAAGGTTGLVRISQLEGGPFLLLDEAEAEDGTRNEDAQLCHAALETLRPEFEDQVWESFLRTAFHGDRAADVAADLGLSVSAVYKSRTRVLNRLRQLLASE
jgi:RNA polymerase sigma-70 factor (ECF subfamily)